MSGTVSESNAKLADAPELLNQDPYGAGWLMRLQLVAPAARGSLLSADAYRKFLDEESV